MSAPTLHDLATEAEEIAIPLDAARDLINQIIGNSKIKSEAVYLAVALRSVIEDARNERHALTARLYAKARAEKEGVLHG